MSDNYTHPTLGELYPEDVDWQIDDASVPFTDESIQVCLADGTDDGPSNAALSAYEWVESSWQEVLSILEEQAFEFYAPYADAITGVPSFNEAKDLWGTEQLIAVRVFSKDDFTVTMRFTWQEDEDPHQITFRVENGACITHSVDG